MAVIPEEYMESVCEVKSLRNELLTTGSIIEIGQTSLKISNPGDTIDIITYRTKVKVCIFNTQMGFRVAIGSVYISTPDFLVVEDIQSLTEFEKREFFRINVSLSGSLIEQCQSQKKSVALKPVSISNLSLGGILFSSQERFSLGDELYVDIDLPQGRDVYQCKVCRVIDEDLAEIEYGCQFENCTRRQEDLLWRFILRKQQEELKAKRLKNQNNTLL